MCENYTRLGDLTVRLDSLSPSSQIRPHIFTQASGSQGFLISSYTYLSFKDLAEQHQLFPKASLAPWGGINCFLWDPKVWFNWSLAAIFVSSVHSAVLDAWKLINRRLPHWMSSFPLKPPDRILHQWGIYGNNAFLCCTQCLLANIKVSS